MKLLYRILFFLLAVFFINISEAKVLVFDNVVSETLFDESVFEYLNESVEILENDFGISCKNESNLVDYSDLILGAEASATKGGSNSFRRWS